MRILLFSGNRPSDEVLKVHGVVSGARDAAIARVKDSVAGAGSCAASKWTMPRADTSRAAGYGDCFVRRTGQCVFRLSILAPLPCTSSPMEWCRGAGRGDIDIRYNRCI